MSILHSHSLKIVNVKGLGYYRNDVQYPKLLLHDRNETILNGIEPSNHAENRLTARNYFE